MKKSDLKTGMIIETRNRERGLIIKDNCYGTDAVIFTENSWTELKDFDEDTLKRTLMGKISKCDSIKRLDIMKVYKPNLPCDFINITMDTSCTFGISGFKLIWERKQYEEMTLEEVCKELGKDIKIVKS